MSKVTTKLRLDSFIDLTDVTPDEKGRIKDEVGEFIVDLILKDTSKQMSAVTGKKWKGLSKDYKAIKKEIAPGVANLELHGDMLDALEYKPYRDGIEIGVFDSDEGLKAENHCKTTARARKTALPKRQFIPNKGETFRPGIMKEVAILAQEILDEN